MIDDFVAFVIYDSPPQVDPAEIENFINGLEPGQNPRFAGHGMEWNLNLGPVYGSIQFADGSMPEEAAISSIGMTDMPEDQQHKLLGHGAYAMITCDKGCRQVPMESMIMLLKAGMALCQTGGMALCIPSCGICLQASQLAEYVALNGEGQRVWGIDDSETNLSVYEKRTLWESLRTDAVPAEMIVGFVPAEIQGKTWFFSAGHSLFGLPELAYKAADIGDYATARQFFRALFSVFFKRPDTMRPGRSIMVSNTESLVLAPLPQEYSDFEASTGTLLVQVDETFTPDDDWD